MKVIVRNQLYPMRNRYSYPVPEFNEYEGEQIPAPKWAPAGAICLATGNPSWPMRLLDPTAIVSVDLEIKAPPVSDTKVLQVAGSKCASYTVTIGPKSRTCTCPGFGFRNTCKHIVTVDNPV
jgi:hypothetical protein